MKRLAATLLLACLARQGHGLSHQTPDCVKTCYRDVMQLHHAPDTKTLCTDIATQRSLFLCLAGSCLTHSYGPALAHSITECSRLGAAIGNLQPVELQLIEAEGQGQLPAAIAARSESGTSGPWSGASFSLGCSAGTDGVLTLSLPSNHAAATAQPFANGASSPGSAGDGIGHAGSLNYVPSSQNNENFGHDSNSGAAYSGSAMGNSQSGSNPPSGSGSSSYYPPLVLGSSSGFSNENPPTRGNNNASPAGNFPATIQGGFGQAKPVDQAQPNMQSGPQSPAGGPNAAVSPGIGNSAGSSEEDCDETHSKLGSWKNPSSSNPSPPYPNPPDSPGPAPAQYQKPPVPGGGNGNRASGQGDGSEDCNDEEQPAAQPPAPQLPAPAPQPPAPAPEPPAPQPPAPQPPAPAPQPPAPASQPPAPASEPPASAPQLPAPQPPAPVPQLPAPAPEPPAPQPSAPVPQSPASPSDVGPDGLPCADSENSPYTAPPGPEEPDSNPSDGTAGGNPKPSQGEPKQYPASDTTGPKPCPEAGAEDDCPLSYPLQPPMPPPSAPLPDGSAPACPNGPTDNNGQCGPANDLGRNPPAASVPAAGQGGSNPSMDAKLGPVTSPLNPPHPDSFQLSSDATTPVKLVPPPGAEQGAGSSSQRPAGPEPNGGTAPSPSGTWGSNQRQQPAGGQVPTDLNNPRTGQYPAPPQDAGQPASQSAPVSNEDCEKDSGTAVSGLVPQVFNLGVNVRGNSKVASRSDDNVVHPPPGSGPAQAATSLTQTETTRATTVPLVNGSVQQGKSEAAGSGKQNGVAPTVVTVRTTAKVDAIETRPMTVEETQTTFIPARPGAPKQDLPEGLLPLERTLRPAESETIGPIVDEDENRASGEQEHLPNATRLEAETLIVRSQPESSLSPSGSSDVPGTSMASRSRCAVGVTLFALVIFIALWAA